MAEAYKGLTIRIGADTTDFSRKLKSLGTAISATQAGLKQMTQALQNNPQSLDAMNQRFTLMQSQTKNLQAKLQLINTMLRQMDESGMGELAAETQDSALQARLLTDRLNQVNANLEQEHEKLAAIGKELGIAYDKTKPKDFQKAVNDSFDMLDENSRQAKATVDMLVDSVSKLSIEHHKVEADLEQMKNIDAYNSLKRDAVALEAQLVSAYEEMNAFRMAMPSQAEAQKLNLLETEFKELNADMYATEEIARSAKASMYLDPKNPQKFDEAVKAIRQQFELTAKQAENLRQRIAAIKDANGIDEVKGDLHELMSDARTAGDNFADWNRKLSQVQAAVDKAEAEQKSFVNTTREGAQQLNNNAKHARDLQNKIDILRNAMQRYEAKAKEAGEAAKMAEARVELKKLENQLTVVNSKMERFGNTSKRTKTSMLNGLRDMATSLGATVAPAIASVSSKVISSADTIDAAFRDMKKTVDGTEEQFQQLRQAAIEFSRTHPVSADTILEIEAMGGQLGIAVENLEAFASTVSNLDIATNMDAENIAIDLGKLANVMHITNEEYDSFADSLVRLGNNFPALESDIMNITTRMAGMATIVGVMPDEILAIATAATATGQKADAAGGALQRTFGRIEGAVAGVSDAMKNLDDMTDEDIEAFEKAKDSLKDYADIAGMSVDEFASLWENNEKLEDGITGTTHAFKAFVEGLKKIDDEGGSVDATLQKLGITGVRDRQLLEGLTNTTNILDDALRQSKDAWGDVANGIASGGDAAREAEKKAEGFSGKLAILKYIAQTVGAAFGDKLVPLLDAAIAVMQQAAKVIDEMPEPVAMLIASMAALAVAIPPILRNYAQFNLTLTEFTNAQAIARAETEAMGKGLSLIPAKGAVKSLGDLKNHLKNYATSADLATKGTKLLKAGMAALTVAGVAVLIAGIKKLIERQIEYSKATKDLKNVFYTTGQASSEFLSKLGDTMAYQSARSEVDKYISKLAQLHDELSDMAHGAADSIYTMERWGAIVKDNLDVAKDDYNAVSQQKLAVEQLNEQYSLGLEIREKNGRLIVANADVIINEASAIDALIDAKKREIELKAYQEMLLKLRQEEAEAVRTVQEATDAYAKAQADLNEAYLRGEENLTPYNIAIADAEDNLKRAEAAQDSVNKSIEQGTLQYQRAERFANGTATAADRYADANKNLAAAMDSISANEMEKFAQALQDNGIELDQLTNLTGVDIAQIKASWQAGTTDWVDIIKTGTSRIKGEMSSAVSEANVTGYNISAGLAAGMRAGMSLAINAAREVAAKSIEAANDEAGVASPSKKTRYTGRMIDQGLIVGMKDYERDVERQASVIASLALGQSAYGNSASAGLLSGMAASRMAATSTTTNNTSQETKYILSGDINITTQNGDPQEIVGEVVRFFSRVQDAYA